MRDAGIGRLVVASLHQAIAELLPARLSFYEGWLSAEGFRNGHLDLAGLFAVLSFLRAEGSAYDEVVRRAGVYATDWFLASMPKTSRTLLRLTPEGLRTRRCVRLARRMVIESYRDSKVTVRWRGGIGRLSIRHSLFCEIRGQSDAPLCGYYAAVIDRLNREFSTHAAVRIAECQSGGAETCALEVISHKALGRSGTAAVCLVPLLLFVAIPLGPSQAASSTRLDVPGQQAVPAPERASRGILVMPFEVESREGRHQWLGEGAAVIITDALDLREAPVISRDERLRAFERLQVPPLAALSRATVIRVGQLVGADSVVTGSISVSGDSLTVSARCLRLDSGRFDEERQDHGAITDLFAVVGRLASSLDLDPQPARDRKAPSSPPPFAAFEPYVKGLVADAPAAQIANLNAAIAVFPAFDQARIASWKALTGAGDHKGALSIVEPVPQGSRAYVTSRFLISCSQVALKQHADALLTLTSLLKVTRSPSVLNNVGVVQLRLSPAAAESGGRPTWYFNQAREIDPQDPDFVFNLGYAYWIEHDAGAATYWLKEAVRLNPADGAAHAVLSLALKASGASSESLRELELAQQLSSAYDGIGKRTGDAESSLRGLARLKDSLAPPNVRRVEAVLEAGGQREREELAASYLERGRRLFAQARDSEAASELRRALYLSPYQAEAHLLLGQVYLRTGRVRDAVDELKISLWSEETLPAHLALAEAYLQAKNDAGARTEVQRALAMDPNSGPARQLLDRIGPPRLVTLPI